MLKSKIEIGNYISSKIKEKNMSQNDLAGKIKELRGEGYEKNSIKDNVSKWIRGERYPGAEYLYYLSIVLEVSIEEILEAGEVCDKYDTRTLTLYTIGKAGTGEELDKLMISKDNSLPFGTNYDEYHKTIFDYALEFENIGLLHYILEKKYVFFDHYERFSTRFRIMDSEADKYFNWLLTLALKYDDVNIFKHIIHRTRKISLDKNNEIPSNQYVTYNYCNYSLVLKKELINKILNLKNILNYLSTPFIPTKDEFDALNRDIIYGNEIGKEELRVREIETISPVFNLLLSIACLDKMEIAKKLIEVGKEHNSKALTQLNKIYTPAEYKIRDDGNVVASGVGVEYQSLTRLAGAIDSVGKFTLIK